VQALGAIGIGSSSVEAPEDVNPRFDVLGVARLCTDGAAAVRSVQTHEPDVALMDLSMPAMGGLEATRRIAAEHPDTDVLVLTMSADDDSILAALRGGARGCLLKEADPDDIADAVRAVARGASVLGSRVSHRVMDMLAAAPPPGTQPPFPSLTHREREVLDLVARGYDNPDQSGTIDGPA